MIINKNSGQSLLEVVFAIGVMALIMTALVSLSITSVRNSTSARNRTVASRYSQEAIETFRAERDVNYDTFKNNVNTVGALNLCLQDLSSLWAKKVTNPVNCDTITSTNFIRFATFDTSDPEFVSVKVTTRWKEGSLDREVINQVDLSDPRAQ